MSPLDQEEKYRTPLLGAGVTAVSMPEGCSIIWAELCFPIICLLGKESRGSIIKDISVKVTEDYNAAVNGKRKGKWERAQTMTVFSLEVCLWHFFRGRNTLRIKCHRQIDPGPPSVASCPSQQELTGKQNWELGISCKACFQHHCLQGPFPAPCGDGRGQNTLLSGNLCWCYSPWED